MCFFIFSTLFECVFFRVLPMLALTLLFLVVLSRTLPSTTLTSERPPLPLHPSSLRYKIMTIKCLSKFELRRLCKCTGATAIARLGAPLPDEMGYVESVHVRTHFFKLGFRLFSAR